MDIKCGIYLIKNNINNKCYIGQSINIMRRWWEHKARAFNCNNNCYNKPLYNAIRKYGIENFSIEILEECSEEQLNEKEYYYIQKNNTLVPNGYNILESSDKNVTKTCHCKNCGKIISRETKTNLCHSCYNITLRKAIWPSREELKQLIYTTSFLQIGKMFNVSDNAVRKWCIYYNLPSKSKEIKQYNKKDWELI